MKKVFHAALFDLDGVILDTEGQYTRFWGEMGRRYVPSVPDFAQRIKGQTLLQMFDAWFPEPDVQCDIKRLLDEFEMQMTYPYIKGAHAYVKALHEKGVPTAIVTSSNLLKMENVYRLRPELKELFTLILTSEDFKASKPDPDCYLCAAQRLGVPISECVVFEDSMNGLRAGRASGAYVVGLATTNPKETIAPLCDEVVEDFESRPPIRDMEGWKGGESLPFKGETEGWGGDSLPLKEEMERVL